MTEAPTIFQFTHWKAGSTWVDAILRRAVPGMVVEARRLVAHIREDPLIQGKVYTRAYMTQQEFEDLNSPPDSKTFVVIRDIRDTAISLYFSARFSHTPIDSPGIVKSREIVTKHSFKEGLEWSASAGMLSKSAEIQRSWLGSGATVLRYEDLLGNDVEILERVLIDECGLQVEPQRLRAAVRASRFVAMSGGRAKGDEDHTAHERKGVAGDWRNYLRGPLKQTFKDQYGDLLIETGYEQDLDW